MRALAGSNASDLDDLIQLAAVQVFANLPGFEGRSDLTTWVYSVCYRVLLKHRRWYRRWSLRFTLDHDDTQAMSPEILPHAAVEARERLQALQTGLARMSDKYRAVVVLHDLEELSVPEVAAIVDCNQLTVRSRLRDGRKQLRKLLESDATFNYGGLHELTPS
jgi:RNA polymerase sigma-70 factor, ECF subfamily